MSARNPKRHQRTQQEIDESFKSSYWIHAVEYGVQYYVAGRFAIFAHFTPVCASILHHAVERLLKACFAREDTADQIRAYGKRDSYGHSLTASWQEFKRRNSTLDLSTYDEIIGQLDAFERIRYPERLIAEGARFNVGLYEVEPLLTIEDRRDRHPEPQYVLMLPQIDRLTALLFKHAQYNPEVLQSDLLRNKHAAAYHALQNAMPLVPP
jgi:hypothetical protein